MISRWDSDVFEGDLSDSIVSDLKSKLSIFHIHIRVGEPFLYKNILLLLLINMD